MAPATAWANPWKAADVDGGHPVVDLSCDFGGFCGVVDGTGTLLYSSNPRNGASSWKRYRLDRNSGVQTEAVSCYSPLDCAAVDSGGNAVVAENRQPWVQISRPVDPGQRLTDVSCVARGEPTQGFCAAVDNRGHLVVTDDPLAGVSATWSAPASIDAGPLDAIACPSSSLCVAADSLGRILVSSDPEAGSSSKWTRSSVDGGHPINDVDCVTVSPASNTVAICAASDATGRVLISTKPAAGAWEIKRIGSHSLTGVSCASTSMCAAVDTAGHAFASGKPTGPASSWTKTRVAAHGLKSVSCLQLSLQCSAIDRAGNVYTTTDAIGTLPGPPGPGLL